MPARARSEGARVSSMGRIPMALWRRRIADMRQQREERPYRKVTPRSLSPTLADGQKSGAGQNTIFGTDSHVL